MRELPAGTVTLLFTDIEGSTALLHSLGDEYADALAEHRRILRAAFTKRGGVEVDTQGDAFFYAFTRAGEAVEAASAGQDALGDCALIRGDCDDSEDLYRASLRAALPLADVLETSFEVQGVGMSAAGRGDWARGLRLVAAGYAMWESAGYAMWESIGATLEVPFWNALLDRYAGVARAGLGSEAEAVWAEGHALPFDDAVTLALG